MQVLRLVQSGHPDKLIAFDELPERFLKNLEMRGCEGLPRHWKQFVGEHERHIHGTLEKNMLTNKIEKVGEEVIVAPYFYVLWYREINQDKERWSEITAFVKRVVHLTFRLMDKLEDMALPMAVDAHGELKLEPEDLETNGAIVPIPLEFQEKDALGKPSDEKATLATQSENLANGTFHCIECEKDFKNERGLEIHMFRKHPRKVDKPVAA